MGYMKSAGTSSDGYGTAKLRPCDPSDHRFFWHAANKGPDGKCCGGLRAWNTDQCLENARNGEANTYICDVSGRRQPQAWAIKSDGTLQQSWRGCIGPSTPGSSDLAEQSCGSLRGQSIRWSKQNAHIPLETQLYRKAQREQTSVFGHLGVQPEALAKAPVPATCTGGGATCFALDLPGTAHCLDEGGLPTSARNYCGLFVRSNSRVMVAASGLCLDSWNDDDPETWGFYPCHDGLTQNFEEVPGDCASKLCLHVHRSVECLMVAPAPLAAAAL